MDGVRRWSRSSRKPSKRLRKDEGETSALHQETMLSSHEGKFERKIVSTLKSRWAPVDEAEGTGISGDLLLHSGRAESEQTYLQKPGAGSAKSLGTPLSPCCAFVKVRCDEARKSLERARLAANSGNYLIHYYYAFARERPGYERWPS